MAIGNQQSPIVQAIAHAEAGTTGEIRVHLSRKWIEQNPMQRARTLFEQFGMHQTTHRNAVLIYVNLRRRKFAIFGDSGVNEVVGPHYWEQVATNLREHLRGTHPERAIAFSVQEVGEVLKKYFPADPDSDNTNELPNLVSED